jgi:putative NIF3 family GTP cyclohydrolase 1 type 2
MNVNEYISWIKESFDIPYVKITGEKYDSIKTVAFGNGSLSYYIDEIKNLPCDVYVTGEIKYHDEVAYINNHNFVISLGHYESEKMFTEDLAEQLIKNYSLLTVVSYNHQMSSII